MTKDRYREMDSLSCNAFTDYREQSGEGMIKEEGNRRLPCSEIRGSGAGTTQHVRGGGSLGGETKSGDQSGMEVERRME